MAITRNSVGDPTHKACFCDGSCKESGFCGVGISDLVHRYPSEPFYGPGLIDKGQETITNPCMEIPKPTMAEKLREKAESIHAQERLDAERKAQKLYETLIPYFEKAAEQGDTCYLVDDEYIRQISLSAFNEVMAKEGFNTSNHNNGIIVSWSDELVYTLR